MKKYIIVITAIIFFVGCKEEGLEGFLGGKNNNDLVFELVENKKGVNISYRVPTWSTRIGRLKAHWHVAGNLDIQPTRPDGVDFTPVLDNTEGEVAAVTSQANEGGISAIHGYIDPDSERGANISVEDALDQWEQLQALEVDLVSPLVSNPRGPWMQDFMAGVKEKGLRVDYVAMRWFGEPDPIQFAKAISDAFYAYQIPVWITEFAVENGDYTEEDVLAFMKEVMPSLDELTYVHRYAWLNVEPGSEPYGISALFDENDELTPVGTSYTEHRENSNAGVGDDSFFDASLPSGSLVISYNADEGEYNDPPGASNSLKAGGCANKIGEALVHMDGTKGGDGDKRFSYDVTAPVAGDYDMEITYWNNAAVAKLQVYVNDVLAFTLDDFEEPGFCFAEANPPTLSTVITLEEGMNTVGLSPEQGSQSPWLGKIEFFSK